MPPRSPTARARRAAGASLALGAVLALAGTGVASAQGLDVVTDGLSSPRGLTWGPGGALYVAEAGSGGDGACITGPDGGTNCLGATGQITRVNVAKGRQKVVVAGLPSLAEQGTGANAVGPQDISFQGSTAYFTVGLGADPNVRGKLGPDGPKLAWLYRMRQGRAAKPFVDLGAFEAANNPDKADPTTAIDSNPFSVDASVPGRLLVTDAGGNDLLQVGAKGKVEVLTVFPSKPATFPPGSTAVVPYQAVPTGVVRGPRGDAFLGQLTGFPFPAGAANVYRQRGKGAPNVFRKGFTTVIDVAFGRHKDLYVLQLTTNGLAAPDPGAGRLWHITAKGRRTELAQGELTTPSGLAVAPNGDAYVSDQGLSPADGRIVRIPLHGGH
jgi:hypothetical protein